MAFDRFKNNVSFLGLAVLLNVVGATGAHAQVAASTPETDNPSAVEASPEADNPPGDDAARALIGLSANQILGLIGAPPLLPGDVVFQINQLTTETQLAAFGEVSYEVLPRLTVTAGARVSRSELELFEQSSGPLAGGGTLTTGTQKNTPVTPKVSI